MDPNFSLSVYCVPGAVEAPKPGGNMSAYTADLTGRLAANLRVAGQNMAASLVLLSSLIMVVCITLCFTVFVFKNKIE